MVAGTSSFVVGHQFQADRGMERSAAAPTAFAGDVYDAIKPAGKRRQPSSMIIREDVHLRGQKRNQMQANAADLHRNFAIAAWMVRRHLDYVARFAYQPQTGDRELDKQLKLLMDIQSRPTNMDRGRRLTREKLFRLAEARRVLDGDFGLLRLRNGQIQTIKADLIKNPPAAEMRDDKEWESGVRIDGAGAQQAYAIHARTKGGRGTKFQRSIDAANFHLYGFFDDGPADQVRGITRLSSAIADCRDIYEAIDYAKVKIKIAQLMGIKFTRKDSSSDLNSAMPGACAEEDCDDDDLPRSIDWSGGVATFDLDEGEDAQIIESATPSTQFQEFIRVVIMVMLKSLDIPYSFFDEKHTNFHGSRGAWLQYDRSCLDKRDDQIEMRRRWTTWQHQRWVYDGLLVLPAKMKVEDIGFQWVPKGMPWWKPSEEVTGALKAIGGGLDNPFRVCSEYDRGDPLENVDRTLDLMEYAHKEGERRIGEPLRLSFEADFPQVIEVQAQDQTNAD